MRAARRLPRQHQRDLDVPRPLRATPRGRGRPTTRSSAPPRACSRWPRSRPCRTRSTGSSSSRSRSVTKIAGGIAAQRHPRPGRVPRQLPLRAGPQRRGGRGAAGRALRRARRAARSTPTRRPARSPSGPRVDALVAAGELVRAPKQAWTPVAEFGLAGLPAVNFGPGDPAQAHRRDESVEIAALVRAYEVLERFAREGCPGLAGAADVPVRPPRRGQAAAARRRRRT